MKRVKIIYYSILVIILLLVTSVYISFAYFTSKNEENGKLNIVAGTLDYKIESEDLINNEITVGAGQTKEILIKLTSLNSIDSKYELYYTLNNENEDVEVGYSSTTSDSISGTIDANGVKKITVIIRNNSDTNTTVTFNAIGGLEKYELVLNQGNSLNQEITLYSCEYTPGTEFVFDYTGSPEEFTVPCSGTYKVELWGAGGGAGNSASGVNTTSNSGKGGYTAGTISLGKNTSLYVYIGEKGKAGLNGDGNGTAGTGALATFNGGGAGGTGGVGTSDYPSNIYTGGPSGGGATDIRLVNGNWNEFTSLKSRIMVAGGGGGYDKSSRSNTITGGNNRGLIGGDGATIGAYSGNDYTNKRGIGGTQTSGYNFGFGGMGDNTGAPSSYNICHGHGGGGGGYYGGTGGQNTSWNCFIIGGGAGSSFISGHTGSDAISESSTVNNIIHTGSPNHYSGYIFTNTTMIEGTSQVPNFNGTATMTGNSGNGYAKITHLGD